MLARGDVIESEDIVFDAPMAGRFRLVVVAVRRSEKAVSIQSLRETDERSRLACCHDFDIGDPSGSDIRGGRWPMDDDVQIERWHIALDARAHETTTRRRPPVFLRWTAAFCVVRIKRYGLDTPKHAQAVHETAHEFGLLVAAHVGRFFSQAGGVPAAPGLFVVVEAWPPAETGQGLRGPLRLRVESEVLWSAGSESAAATPFSNPARVWPAFGLAILCFVFRASIRGLIASGKPSEPRMARCTVDFGVVIARKRQDETAHEEWISVSEPSI